MIASSGIMGAARRRSDELNSLVLYGTGEGQVIREQHGYTVTVTGDATQKSTYRRFIGNSLYFDGVGDRILCATGDTYPGDFTIECFATVCSSSVAQCLFIVGPDHVSGMKALFMGAFNKINVYFLNTDGSFSPVINLNTGFHLRVVRSGSTVKSYLNGVVFDTRTRSGTIDPTALGITIGDTYSPEQPLCGYVSDFRVYKRALNTGDFIPPTRRI